MKDCPRFVLLSACITVISAIQPLSKEFIDSINALNSSWTAGKNFHVATPIENLGRLLGARLPGPGYVPRIKTHHLEEGTRIPEIFDARKQWPYCPTLQEVWNQGACGSCWAFGATEAMSDRTCIHSQGRIKVRLSPDDLVACCHEECNGCNGGMPGYAWDFWVKEGVVTGAGYGSEEGCSPYEVPPQTFERPPSCPCNALHDIRPRCTRTCRVGYNVSYEEDKHFGESSYQLSGEMEQIQTEIMTNGPVEATFLVYEDFYSYRSGVYQHLQGGQLGAHAVKLLGWGVDNGVPYWLLANSWGTGWGEGGFFRILRGENHCEIEQYIVAGIPKN